MIREVDEQYFDFIQSAYAPSTAANFKRESLNFINFCIAHCLEIYPPDVMNIARYLTVSLQNITSHSTLMNKISSLKKFYALSGYTVPADHPILLLLTRASRRELSITARPKAPVEPGHIILIGKMIDGANPLHILFYVALNIQFFTCIRKSNLLPPSVRAYSPFHHLSRGDLHFVPGALIVTLPWTKTIQGKEDILTLSIVDAPGAVLDPVGEYRNFILRFPPPAQTVPAFSIIDASRVTVLTQPVYIDLLKQFLARLGLPPESFSSHSLRRGSATCMAQSGVSNKLIQFQGGWKSHCYEKYITVMQKDRLIPTQKMIEHINITYGNTSVGIE